MDTREKLQMCADTLREITESGYWPFASPAPCSTEVKIKENICAAIARVESALFWHDQEFTNPKRDSMKCTNFTIK